MIEIEFLAEALSRHHVKRCYFYLPSIELSYMMRDVALLAGYEDIFELNAL